MTIIIMRIHMHYSKIQKIWMKININIHEYKSYDFWVMASIVNILAQSYVYAYKK